MCAPSEVALTNNCCLSCWDDFKNQQWSIIIIYWTWPRSTNSSKSSRGCPPVQTTSIVWPSSTSCRVFPSHLCTSCCPFCLPCIPPYTIILCCLLLPLLLRPLPWSMLGILRMSGIFSLALSRTLQTAKQQNMKGVLWLLMGVYKFAELFMCAHDTFNVNLPHMYSCKLRVSCQLVTPVQAVVEHAQHDVCSYIYISKMSWRQVNLAGGNAHLQAPQVMTTYHESLTPTKRRIGWWADPLHEPLPKRGPLQSHHPMIQIRLYIYIHTFILTLSIRCA